MTDEQIRIEVDESALDMAAIRTRNLTGEIRQLANAFADLSARLPAMTATLRELADLLEGKDPQ